MKYNYQFFEGSFLPIIPIQMEGKKGWMKLFAFVDTGASYSLFHADVAELLGISLEKGEKSDMVLGDGKTLQVYLHQIKIILAEKEFIARIGFSKDIGINMDIIGRKSIFDKFIVSFNDRDKYTELNPDF